MKGSIVFGLVVVFAFVLSATFGFYSAGLAGQAPPLELGFCDQIDPQQDGQCCEGDNGFKGVWVSDYNDPLKWHCDCMGLIGPDPNPCDCPLVCPQIP